MRKLQYILILLLIALAGNDALAQADRSQVRAGNRQFKRSEWRKADVSYRKALVADSTSIAANYDLASNLYRQENYEEAGKYLEAIKKTAEATPHAADRWYNEGDVALQKKDYKAAMEAFRQSLLRNPSDLDAKENYLYAKKMLQNQENGGGGDQNQDQQQDNRQDLSKEQVQQLLQAIQAKEKETQDKVNKEKAAALKSRQKEKNW